MLARHVEEASRGAQQTGPRLTLWRNDGSEVVLCKGSRLEWDVLAGIGIAGAGTIDGISVINALGQPFPMVCIEVDPNEELRALAAEIQASLAAQQPPPFVGDPRLVTQTGLNGQGGFFVIGREALERGVSDGTIRLVDAGQGTANGCAELPPITSAGSPSLGRRTK